MTPARWIALTVRVPSAELTEELVEGLVALGGLAVEEEDDRLTTYVPEPANAEAFVAAAAGRLEAIAGTADPGVTGHGRPLEILWRWQEDEDWSARWKDGLRPRRVGRRMVVTQPWNPVQAEGDEIVLVIDPSSAFGTGEHATTRGALRLMEDAVMGGERVLDVGAGSGILSMAAVALGADSALAVESDEGAMATALSNLERAGVQEAVELVNAVVDADYLAAVRGDGFDLIVANVLSGVLRPLLAPFGAAVRGDGRLILGGIMDHEVAEMRTAAQEAGWQVETEDVEGEWWTALMRRR